MTEDGKFVNARFGSGFTFSLISQDIILREGKYIFMVDPVWNESAKNNLEYKQVLIDVFAPQAVNIGFIDDITGIECLAKALKHAAITISPESACETYL